MFNLKAISQSTFQIPFEKSVELVEGKQHLHLSAASIAGAGNGTHMEKTFFLVSKSRRNLSGGAEMNECETAAKQSINSGCLSIDLTRIHFVECWRFRM